MTSAEAPTTGGGPGAAEPDQGSSHPGAVDALTESEQARIREAARAAAATFPPMSDELARLVRRTLTRAAG